MNGDKLLRKKITQEDIDKFEKREERLKAHIDELMIEAASPSLNTGLGNVFDGGSTTADIKYRNKQDDSYPSYPPIPDEVKKLLIEVEAIEIQDTQEWLIAVKAGVKISREELIMLKEGELNEKLIKKIDKLRKLVEQRLKNKQTLIDLLK